MMTTVQVPRALVAAMQSASTPSQAANEQFITAICRNRGSAIALMDQLPIDLTDRVSLTGDELVSKNVLDENSPPVTVATLALLVLLDPTNGWGRDSNARPDILEMASRLVEHGGRLEGVTFWRGTKYAESLLDTVQMYISGGFRFDPQARLTPAIKQRFADAGYEFDYDKRPASSPASGNPMNYRSPGDDRNLGIF